MAVLSEPRTLRMDRIMARADRSRGCVCGAAGGACGGTDRMTLRTVRVTLEITHDHTWEDPAEWDWNETIATGLEVKPSPRSFSIAVIDSEEVKK